MGNAVNIGKLADTIADELASYTTNVASGVKQAATDTMRELVADTKADAPVRYGNYKKAITSKQLFENEFERRLTWYVKSPYHRLAHLLENGHAKRGGGRVRAYPHIEKNREKAESNFEQRVKKVIEDAGK